jgi:hypothetical protein
MLSELVEQSQQILAEFAGYLRAKGLDASNPALLVEVLKAAGPRAGGLQNKLPHTAPGIRRHSGKPCEQGQTQSRTGCIPSKPENSLPGGSNDPHKTKPHQLAPPAPKPAAHAREERENAAIEARDAEEDVSFRRNTGHSVKRSADVVQSMVDAGNMSAEDSRSLALYVMDHTHEELVELAKLLQLGDYENERQLMRTSDKLADEVIASSGIMEKKSLVMQFRRTLSDSNIPCDASDAELAALLGVGGLYKQASRWNHAQLAEAAHGADAAAAEQLALSVL